MSAITWSLTDKTGGITLSNNNLTATGSGNGGVRGTPSLSAGKYYWEYTISAYGGGTPSIGVCSVSASLTSGSTTAQYAIIQYTGGVGQIYTNGSNIANIGSSGVGTVYCVAIDPSGLLIWFRRGAAGNWNNSGTANPATAAGGASFSSMTGIPYLFFGPAFGTDTAVLNGGDTAFTGAVPSGFTAGFSVAAAAQARVMVMA